MAATRQLQHETTTPLPDEQQARVVDGSPRKAWIAGVDGLRALSIFAVFAFHLAPTWVPGGFVGVDVFFVVSGFLITMGLIRERARTGRVDLGMFWVKRARRLLPALALVVLVATSGAMLVGGDVRVDLDRQIFGAMTFASNWVSIGAEDSYFSALSPQIFSNLWSLAVEEQFYLLWPFVVLLIARTRSSRRLGVIVAGAAAAVSAVAMALLWSVDTDPTRVYYGTDTHMFGLMLGALLAFWYFSPRAASPRRDPLRLSWARANAAAVAVVALAVLAAAAFWLPWDSVLTYRGGLVLVSVAASALICALMQPGPAQRWLEAPWLVWVGRRSYGLYLWHWPVFVLLTQIFAKQYVEGTGVSLVWVLTVIVTFSVAAASYRWVESPVQRLGFRGAYERLAAALTTVTPDGAVRLRRRGTVAGSVMLASVALTVAAVATAPHVSSVEEQIEQGMVVAGATPTGEVPGTPAVPDDGTSPEAPATSPAPADPAPTDSATQGPATDAPTQSPAAEPEPAPEPATGADLTIIGDSVTLASADRIVAALPDASIDAEVSRSMAAAPSMLAALEGKGRLRDVVVLSLATNTTLKDSLVADVMKVVGPDRKVILVNAYGNRTWISGTNKALARAAKKYPNVVVADWAAAISKHGEDLAADGIHPKPSGAKIYARVIVDAYESVRG